MVVEQDCVISGNLIENVAGVGVQAGINDGARDLVVTGNLVRGAKMGIGVSNHAVWSSVRSVAISGNIVRSASGVVPTVFTGAGLDRVGAVECGNDLATAVGSVTFGHNRYL
ncbi:hypothetical protein ACXIUS_05490 [Bosea thiooxidans]|nr:hypothetical protein [Bosea sp. (in: a-proteobacteria)]